MPECLHNEHMRDCVICILNLWAPVNQKFSCFGSVSSTPSSVRLYLSVSSTSLFFVQLLRTGDELFLSLVFFGADGLVDSSGSSTPSCLLSPLSLRFLNLSVQLFRKGDELFLSVCMVLIGAHALVDSSRSSLTLY